MPDPQPAIPAPPPPVENFWGTPPHDMSGLKAMMSLEVPPEPPAPAPQPAAPVAVTPAAPVAIPPSLPQDDRLDRIESMLAGGGLADQIANGFVKGMDGLRKATPPAATPPPGPPRVEDPDALLGDANSLQNFVYGTSKAALDRARWETTQALEQVQQQIQPQLQTAAALGAIGPQLLRNEMNRAVRDAEQNAVEKGISAEEFRAALPSAIEILKGTPGGDEERVKVMMDPEAILMAVGMHRFLNGGQPMPPGQPVAASLPPGAPITPAPSGAVPILRDDHARLTEHILGIKFTDDELRARDALVAGGAQNLNSDVIAMAMRGR